MVSKSTAAGIFDLRVVIVLCLLLPWANTTIFNSLKKLIREERSLIEDENWIWNQFPITDPAWILLLFALSVPHIFYYFVWTNASKWVELCRSNTVMATIAGNDPCHAFASSAHVIKVWQAVAMVVWLRKGDVPPISILEMVRRAVGDPSSVFPEFADKCIMATEYITRLNPVQALLGTELLVLGQLLNIAVYSAIGEIGVYYGCRLGHDVPWCYSFPFNFVSHPQYLGASLSTWGVSILLGNMIPLGLPVAITCYYMFSSWVEASM